MTFEKLPNNIALDGPAASGKSTIAEKIAGRIGYLYFDTGVMYRAVTLAALRAFNNVSDEGKVTRLAENVQIDVLPPSKSDGRLNDILLDQEDVTWAIRTAEVDANVSEVSAYGGVRKAMTELQRRIGRRGKVIMVGRDIGTVVMPEAELKIYLDASVETRAERRYREEIARGRNANLEEILTSMRRRDEIDSTREIAPLRKAEDAILVQTDGLSIDEVVNRILAILHIDCQCG